MSFRISCTTLGYQVLLCTILWITLQADNCAYRTFSGRCENCESGWFGDNCDEKCVGYCDQDLCNRQTGQCLVCRENFYGLNCLNECPENCEGSICERGTGNCNFCKDSWWGSSCKKRCPENCSLGRCLRWLGTCLFCRDGWLEENCTEECPVNCEKNECSSLDGFCTKGCKRGRTGSKCDKLCQAGCVDDVCSQLEGICITGCKDGSYGPHCNMTCMQNCTRCDQKTGQCDSCEQGLYGTSCNSTCPDVCVEGKCDIDGNCVEKDVAFDTTMLVVPSLGLTTVVLFLVLITWKYIRVKQEKRNRKDEFRMLESGKTSDSTTAMLSTKSSEQSSPTPSVNTSSTQHGKWK